MDTITTVFWDVGGVLLTNGWDTNARRQAAEKYQLNWDDFQERHELISTEFEKGRLTLDEYLECVVFYKSRDFSKETFREFMFHQSQAKNDTLSLLKNLAASGNYQLATLNNESRELNLYRIERFHFQKYFTAFFSSCFLGTKKPEKDIYLAALDITQRAPAECLYIDDRPLNLETAQRLGINTIHFRDVNQLRQDLQSHGVDEAKLE